MQTMVYTDAPVKGGANYMEPIQSSPSVRAPRPFSFPATPNNIPTLGIVSRY